MTYTFSSPRLRKIWIQRFFGQGNGSGYVLEFYIAHLSIYRSNYFERGASELSIREEEVVRTSEGSCLPFLENNFHISTVRERARRKEQRNTFFDLYKRLLLANVGGGGGGGEKMKERKNEGRKKSREKVKEKSSIRSLRNNIWYLERYVLLSTKKNFCDDERSRLVVLYHTLIMIRHREVFGFYW